MEYGEDIKAAKIVIKMMLKAKKTLRMYPSNNPIYANTLEETFEKFNAFFALKNRLVFTIKLYDIFYGDEIVYHNDNQKYDNLSFFFFKDGLRELSFDKNIPFDEMASFLKVISQDFENEVTDDDTVTLFWENDFQHIRYIVEDEFLADENYEEQAVSQATSREKKPDRFKAIYESSINASDRSLHTDIIDIEEEDLEAIRRAVEADADDKIDKFMDILFEIFYKSKTMDELTEVMDFFKGALEYAVRHGNFVSALRVLKWLKTIGASEKISDGIKEQLNKVISFAGSEHIVFLIGEYLDTGEKKDNTFLIEMVEYFDKNAILPFMSLLSTLVTIHARKAVIDILVLLGPKDFMTVTKGLNSPEWYVVRNIIYVLREIGDQRAVEHLLKKVSHPEPRVRIELLRTLAELGDSRALEPISASLDGEAEAQLRYTAIRAMGSLGSEAARHILMDKIRDKGFDAKDFNEKKEYFQVLSRWKDREMMDFMLDILAKKTLFAGVKGYEKKACAAFGIGLIGGRDALPVLYKCAKTNNKLLQQYCQDAIKRIDNESHRQG